MCSYLKQSLNLLVSLVLPSILCLSSAYAQSVIKGKLLSKGEGIPFAHVVLLDTEFGATTDENGKFEIKDVADGTYSFYASAVGYKHFKKEITIKNSTSVDFGKIELEEDVFGLEEVVVTGTMKETYISASPIKVDVITSKFLEKNTPATNIVEGITMVNGVQEVVACGVCYTNSISINGLPGAYTAVLMDGAPIYGNLASVYGLNGIPAPIIERFEVIKGPVSTLYGSEAVAGVINIITKDPQYQPKLSLDFMTTTHLESFGNVALAQKVGKWNGYVGLNYAYMNHYIDQNDDGFGDMIGMDRLSGFTKWSYKQKNNKKFTIAGKYYYEDRRNGVRDFFEDRNYRDLRGNDSIYGESIYTKRIEAFGTWELPTKQNFKLDYSLSLHDQDSYYGSDHYTADQKIGFTNFTWSKTNGRHQLLTGVTTRLQSYDDNTIATGDTINGVFKNNPDDQVIPGIFLQDELLVSEKLTALIGGRLDYYDAHGVIGSPRLNLKYKPSDWTTFRLNFGTGFRIVNLFTEDHAFVTGQRTVELVGDLKPERSFNFSLNMNHLFTVKESSGMLDVDLFYTYFTNKIIPDYETTGKIIYSNTDGFAVSQGIGVNWTQNLSIPLKWNIGVNFQSVVETEKEDGVENSRDVEFAPDYTGIFILNYTWKKHKLEFAYNTRVTGPMALPEVYDIDGQGNTRSSSRPTESDIFTTHDFQITKNYPKRNLSIYAGIQNIFNTIQGYSPLVGYNDPNAAPGFSDQFDTSYAYGSLQSREFYLGVRWSLGRKR